ncbi:MAG: GNAT family N-acetyltransferase [Chloroflexi bacterium]|nr:GNAT family N-acetyltransferase [Chloroflexota bacterium]
MEIIEERRGVYEISTDRAKLNLDALHHLLSEQAYWALGRPRDVVERSVANSLCFGVYDRGALVGFTRVVTDYATFAWVCDVFIAPSHRGRGLSKWLMQMVIAHPGLQGIKRVVLATRDAHELYHRYAGFEVLPEPGKWMIRSLGSNG